jgi:hypothetical protein
MFDGTGSPLSQRNAQRAGFQVAYSRVKFQRAPGAA